MRLYIAINHTYILLYILYTFETYSLNYALPYVKYTDGNCIIIYSTYMYPSKSAC